MSILNREETRIDAVIFRFAYWRPGPLAIGDFPHYSLRIKTGIGWSPFEDGEVLDEGDTIIQLELPRYRLRALTHPTDGPLILSPVRIDAWTLG
jgi:hypothetical protein